MFEYNSYVFEKFNVLARIKNNYHSLKVLLSKFNRLFLSILFYLLL